MPKVLCNEPRDRDFVTRRDFYFEPVGFGEIYYEGSEVVVKVHDTGEIFTPWQDEHIPDLNNPVVVINSIHKAIENY
jgi:hypothetical protein